MAAKIDIVDLLILAATDLYIYREISTRDKSWS